MATSKPARFSWTAVAIAAVFAAYWTVILFSNLRIRAFDPSDPAEQMFYAERSIQAFRQSGFIAWIGSVVSDPIAKPGTNALLSLGVLLGLPGGHVGYKCVSAIAVIAVACLMQAYACLEFGIEAQFLLAMIFAGSNIVRFMAFSGGHSWFGQMFLWGALVLASAFRWERAVDEIVPSFFFGVLLSAAFLSSYHMAPYCVLLLFVWGVIYLKESLGAGKNLGYRPPIALALGLVALLVFLETATFAVPKQHYWTILRNFGGQTAGVAAIYRAGPGYFLNFLSSCEPKLFALLVVGFAAIGILELILRKDQPLARRLICGALPVIVYVVLALPAVQLGRTYFSLFPFLFLLSALGITAALRAVKSDAGRLAAVVAAAGILFASTHAYRAETSDAFFTGKGIEEAGVSGPGVSGEVVVIGRSLPYEYLPDREIRVQHMAELRAAVTNGAKWVLISPLSAWFWHGFLPADQFDIPVEKIFSSSVPFLPMPGIESGPFERFTNEALYYEMSNGTIPTGIQNRLYRGEDFFAACGSTL